MKHNIETTGELEYQDASGNQRIFRFDSFSKIAESFVAITNTFEEKIEKVFEGNGGLREGKHDAISTALKEVFETELNNNNQLKNATNQLSQLALALSQNFVQMDEWIKRAIESGNPLTKPTLTNIPENYEVFLQETEIFDDVKDVLEAFDKQVEKRCDILTSEIVGAYDRHLTRFKDKCSSISADIRSLKTAINTIANWSNKQIRSEWDETKYRSEYNYWLESSEYIPYVVTHSDEFGQLKNAFPYGVMEAIEYAQDKIVPEIEKLEEILTIATIFINRIYDLHNLLKSAIETAVYKTFDLDEIVLAQTMIGQLLGRISQELSSLQNNLQQENKGTAIENYCLQIANINQLVGYYQNLITDCFGEKIRQAPPATNTVSGSKANRRSNSPSRNRL